MAKHTDDYLYTIHHIYNHNITGARIMHGSIDKPRGSKDRNTIKGSVSQSIINGLSINTYAQLTETFRKCFVDDIKLSGNGSTDVYIIESVTTNLSYDRNQTNTDWIAINNLTLSGSITKANIAITDGSVKMSGSITDATLVTCSEHDPERDPKDISKCGPEFTLYDCSAFRTEVTSKQFALGDACLNIRDSMLFGLVINNAFINANITKSAIDGMSLRDSVLHGRIRDVKISKFMASNGIFDDLSFTNCDLSHMDMTGVKCPFPSTVQFLGRTIGNGKQVKNKAIGNLFAVYDTHRVTISDGDICKSYDLPVAWDDVVGMSSSNMATLLENIADDPAVPFGAA